MDCEFLFTHIRRACSTRKHLSLVNASILFLSDLIGFVGCYCQGLIYESCIIVRSTVRGGGVGVGGWGLRGGGRE